MARAYYPVNGSYKEWTPDMVGAAASSHSHTSIASRGNVTAETGVAGRPAVAGLSMSQVYNNNYPTPYGNVISLRGMGDGQVLVGWSGTDGAYAPVYVRSKRDNTTSANWSDWQQFYTTGYKPSKADVGLGSVDNTADSAKSVKYATSAGSANSVAWANVSGKPTIPSVGNGTITITQNGTSKGSFTMNQSGNATIALSDTNTNTWRGIQNNLTSTSTSDSLSAAQGKVLNDKINNLITISSTQPTSNDCKIWIKI